MPEIQNCCKIRKPTSDAGTYLRYLRKDKKLQDWEAQLYRHEFCFKRFSSILSHWFFFSKSVRDLFLAVESWNHSIIEEFGLERTFKNSSNPMAMSKGIFNSIRLLRSPSKLIFSVYGDGPSTTSLGNLLQCFTTLTVKSSSLYLIWIIWSKS